MKRYIAWIILLVGGAVVAYYVHKVGLTTLVAAFTSMGWNMAGLLALPLFLYTVHALGWGLTMSPANRRRAGLFRLTLLQSISYGIGGMIPLQVFVSEPLKLLFLQDAAYDKDDLAASLVIDNTINGVAIFIWGAGGLVYLSIVFVGDVLTRLCILGVIAAMVVLTTVLIGVQRRGLLSGVLGLAGRLRPLSAFAARHMGRARHIDTYVGDYYRQERRGFCLALFYHVVEKLHGVAEFWLIFHGLGMEVSWSACFFIFAVVSTLDNLLFFLQVGGMETWVSSLLRFMGITRDNINITAALFRRVRFLFWAVCALLLVFAGRRLMNSTDEQA